MTDFRALCAELTEFVARLTKHYYQPAELLTRARAALADKSADADQVLNLAAIIREVDGNNSKGAAALAESILEHPGFRAALADEPAVSNPPGPTDQDLLRLYKVATPCYKVEEYKRELDFARAVLARWGNPAPLADTHYEWELEDAEGEWQAGGSSNSQSDVEREGMRYLQTYTQDGPHKLIIRQHTTQTINEITDG